MQGCEPVGEALGDAVGGSPEQRSFTAAAVTPVHGRDGRLVLARVQAIDLGFVPLRAGAERRAVLDHGLEVPGQAADKPGRIGQTFARG
jgi:hypothetical protein